MMLQKNKSQRVALIKYFLSAPLFILMLILSSAMADNSRVIGLINKKVERVFLNPVTGISNIKIETGLPGTDTPKQIKKMVTKNGPVFTAVENVPQFPGGADAFSNFLAKNIKYPAAARKNNVQGKVIIRFIVEKDGSLSTIEVARGVGFGIDEEALRVVALSPKWIPGIQNRKKVRVLYAVPISFTLGADKHSKAALDKTRIEDGGQSKLMAVGAMNLIVSKTDTGMKVDTFNTKNPTLAPLYIINGKEANSLALVNPVNIESLSVLTDKSAVALYGAKGANGVVVITTKNNKVKTLKLRPVKN